MCQYGTPAAKNTSRNASASKTSVFAFMMIGSLMMMPDAMHTHRTHSAQGHPWFRVNDGAGRTVWQLRMTPISNITLAHFS
jgi:hypothetical protein